MSRLTLTKPPPLPPLFLHLFSFSTFSLSSFSSSPPSFCCMLVYPFLVFHLISSPCLTPYLSPLLLPLPNPPSIFLAVILFFLILFLLYLLAFLLFLTFFISFPVLLFFLLLNLLPFILLLLCLPVLVMLNLLLRAALILACSYRVYRSGDDGWRVGGALQCGVRGCGCGVPEARRRALAGGLRVFRAERSESCSRVTQSSGEICCRLQPRYKKKHPDRNTSTCCWRWNQLNEMSRCSPN